MNTEDMKVHNDKLSRKKEVREFIGYVKKVGINEKCVIYKPQKKL